jgi:hypothetical protein
MGYWLFLLVNAALFLRPAELIPNLHQAPLYEMAIVPCIFVSLPRVARVIGPDVLFAHPIRALVVGLMGTVVISAVLNGWTTEHLQDCIEFAKLLIYFLLMIALVDTPAKLRGFVYFLCLLIFILTVLALLRYVDYIDLPALSSYAERQWELEEDEVEVGEGGLVLLRLNAAGLFKNPNDYSRILIVGIFMALYGLGDPRLRLTRLVWAILVALFGIAQALTYSRGGFLGMLVGLLVLLWGRFGIRRTMQLSLVALPILFVLFAGRQTRLDTSAGTGHHRITIWSDCFDEWRTSPLFGIGMNNYPRSFGIVAHNSFVHSLVELGLIGGTCFLGAFYLGVLLPFKARIPPAENELRRFRPYLMGIVSGYMMGMTSSSINYIVPTYTVVGLAAVHAGLAKPYLPARLRSLNSRLVKHLALVSLLGVVGLYLFIRLSLARS